MAHENEFAEILGRAVIDNWGSLPRPVQEEIFETAVRGSASVDASSLREALAVFLHERHPRTADA
jgi:hypothetical protein